MSKSIAVALLGLAGLFSASEAQAQHVIRGRQVASVVAYSGPTAGYAATTAAHTYPYSYYVAYPNPARGYAGYGPQDNFNFYGQPYGHPYDPWTWPYLGGGYSRSLARYYDPPVK